MATNSKIPDNYQTVMPYLIIRDAGQFIVFMQKVFDAEESYKSMRDENTIMHAELLIGSSTIMLADSTKKFSAKTAGLFIYVDDADDTFKKAINAGATIVTEVTDQPYGRSGALRILSEMYGGSPL